MNKYLISAAFVAALAAVSPAQAQKAAPAAASAAIPGLAYANPDGCLLNSAAFKTAQVQRPVTYKAQIDAAEARRNQLQAQLKPMVDKFQADQAAAKPDQASLQQQAVAIQQLQESGQAELQRMMQPVSYSDAYVREQIAEKLPAAVNAAMAKKRVQLLLSQESVLLESGPYNLNPDIVTELNALIPTAQLVPPAGWEPRQVREARAQQGGAAAAAPTTSTQPSGR